MISKKKKFNMVEVCNAVERVIERYQLGCCTFELVSAKLMDRSTQSFQIDVKLELDAKFKEIGGYNDTLINLIPTPNVLLMREISEHVGSKFLHNGDNVMSCDVEYVLPERKIVIKIREKPIKPKKIPLKKKQRIFGDDDIDCL